MRHLWILLRLRALLTVRAVTGQAGRVAAAVVALGIAGLTAAIGGIGVFAAASQMPDGARDRLALAVTGGFALATMLGPGAARPAGGLPLGRVLAWPIRPRVLLAAGMLGGFVAGPGLLAVPALVGLAIGLPGGGAGALVLRLGLVAVLVAHALALAGTVGLAVALALRIRRLRETLMVLGPLLAMGFWLLPAALLGPDGSGFGRALDVMGRVWPAAWIGRAMVGVGDGTLAPLFPVVAGLVPLTIALFGADAWLFGRLALAETSGARPVAGPTSGLRIADALTTILPAGEVVRREWRLMWREPAWRAFVVQLGLLAALPLVLVLLMPGMRGGGMTPLLALLVFLLGSREWRLLSNLLGLEGRGLAHTLALPVDRTRLLLGKAIAHGSAFAIAGAAVLTLAGVALGNPRAGVLAVCAALAALPPLIGAGAYVTAWLPYRLATRGRRPLEEAETPTEDIGTGCLRSLAGLVAFALAIPPVAAVVTAAALGPGGMDLLAPRAALALAAAAALFALVWGVAVAGLGIRAAGRLLPSREEALVLAIE